ncbi:MAG: carboxypeptidase regulatory-like domain-containing protein [Saprospiraceae bacterium]|nr:carboxypeptidase regulatory-like domain-containing protein [Saprospiraceae bacterium]
MSNQQINDIDAGLYRFSNLGDFIWEDMNANGVQDANENGIENVQISLTGTSGIGQAINLTVLTDTNGKYSFGSLEPGSYTINVAKPNNYNWTRSNFGNTDTDSDFANGSLSNIVISSGTTRNDLDGGLFRYAGLGDFVWSDVNLNGRQDVGESGIRDISIQLNGTDGAGNAVTDLQQLMNREYMHLII